MKDLVSLFKEANEANTDELKKKFIERHSSDNRFLGILQSAYGRFCVLPQFSEKDIDQNQVPDDVVSNMKFFDFIDRLRKCRSENLTANALISAYINSHQDKKDLVLGVLNRDVFGLSFKLCQEVVPEWFQDAKVMTTTKFRDDFYSKKYKVWQFFRNIEGASFVKVFKFGGICEVFPRSGRPFRNLDKFRQFFQWNIPADGVFDALLYFEDESGKSSQSLYLKKTAQKEQLEDYRFLFVDYAPVSVLKGYDFKFQYRRRHKMLKDLFSGTEISSCKVCEISQIINTSKPKTGNILIADDVHYLEKEPKHCLES